MFVSVQIVNSPLQRASPLLSTLHSTTGTKSLWSWSLDFDEPSLSSPATAKNQCASSDSFFIVRVFVQSTVRVF